VRCARQIGARRTGSPLSPAQPPNYDATDTLGRVARSRIPLIRLRLELETVRDLLERDDVPLVTLTGPGSVDKTRLGREIASEMVSAFADGAFGMAGDKRAEGNGTR
jgi:hypothetical protein